jgi:hypothetical protein
MNYEGVAHLCPPSGETITGLYGTVSGRNQFFDLVKDVSQRHLSKLM